MGRILVGSIETHNNKIQSGYTLIEVLISLLLISMLLGVMVTLIINSSGLNSRTNKRSDASSLAFKKIQDYINLDFDNIPIGDAGTAYEVEDFSAEALDIDLANATAKIYVEPETELPTGSTTTTTNYSQTVSADAAYVSGSEINSIDVDDATGDYWNRNRISDDSYTNYTYSRYSNNPNNMASPSIDLGSSTLVSTLRVNWYYCGYGADNFRVEAKNSSPNSNSGWTTIVSGLSDNGIPCTGGSHPQDIDVSSNSTPYRHWRLYIVDAEDNNYNVFSELEAFSGGTPGDIVEQHGSDASSSPGSLYFSSSDLEMSEDGSRGHQSIGIIFDDIDTPQGASIDSAYIEFTADESDSSAVSLRVIGVDTDSAPQWTTNFAVDNAVDNDLSDGLVGTSATTVWSPPSWSTGDAGSNTQVDVASIVQEIVDRPGWSADNNLAIAIQYISGNGVRVGERNPEPRLVLNWSESVTTPTAGNYVDDNMDGDVDNPTLVRVTAVIEYDSGGIRRKAEYSSFIRKFGIGG